MYAGYFVIEEALPESFAADFVAPWMSSKLFHATYEGHVPILCDCS